MKIEVVKVQIWIIYSKQSWDTIFILAKIQSLDKVGKDGDTYESIWPLF